MAKLRMIVLVVFMMTIASLAYAELQLSDKTGAFPETYRNEVYLRTGERGCNACHDDLVEMSQRAGPIQHAMANMRNMYGKELNVNYCLACHNLPKGGLGPRLGEAIHGSHTPARGFTGDCFSCHVIEPQSGKMLLWDRVKYDPAITSGWWAILSDTPSGGAPLNTVRDWLAKRKNFEGYRDGFTMDPDFKGKITFNQEKMTAENDQFVAQNYGKPESFLPKNLENDYTITVTGPMAKKTKTYKLADLRKFSQYKQVFARECAINPAGGAMVYQTEFEGPLLADILKDAGMKPGANFARFTSYDGWQAAASIKQTDSRKGQLSLKMRGKTIDKEFGGPVSYGQPGRAGGGNVMWVKTIEILEIEPNRVAAMESMPIKDVNEPVNAGFLVPARDGEVVGKKATFEGWAYAWNDVKITRLLFSADNGKTWHDYYVPENIDALKWINFKFEWEAPKTGVYLIKMKAIADNNNVPQVTEANTIVVVK